MTLTRRLPLLTRSLPLLLIGVLPPTHLIAQSTAEIRGTVQDESGAVVPGVTVTAINELTGLERATVSDDGGRFTLPRLPVGSYRVEASLEGFRKFATATFRLNVEDVQQVNVVMSVGQLSDAVTVSGSAPKIETVGGTISEIVDERRIRELPLNGRDPLQLQLLLPGVVQGPGTTTMQQQGGIAVHGLRGTSNNYMLDGGDNNDALGGVAALVPNPDALEEFTVQTSNFSAEYGRNMGAVINAVTKSGTNQFRGSLYEFLRNDALDAKQFFALEKGKLRRNQYGGSLGGPITRDRTFFFFAYEGLRERRGVSTSNLVVPTAAERAGDFSQSSIKPRDPLTGQPFLNHQIPASRFDPAAVNFLEKMIPLPNQPTGQHIYNRPAIKDGEQFMGRVDMQLTGAQRLFGRFFYDTNESVQGASNAEGAGSLPILKQEVNFVTWNVAANHTHILSQRLVNSLQFAYAETDLDRGPLPTGDNITYQSLGVNVNQATSDPGVDLPTMFRGSVAGFWSMNQDAYEPDDRPTLQIKNDTTYTRGSHVLKFGGEYRWSANNRTAANCNDPCFDFNGQYSGNAFADFLLGRASQVQQFSVRYNKGRSQTFALYAQDDWQVSSPVTLSLGVRWEPFFAFYELDQPQPVFRPGQQSTMFPHAPVGLLYAGDPGIPRGGHPTKWGNVAPRVAAAWSLNPKTSIRAAYGIFYDTARFFTFPKAIVFTPPYSLSRTTPNVQFSDPYAGLVNPYPYLPPQTPEEIANYQFSRPVRASSVPEDFSNGYSQQWNVSIQRELMGDLVVKAAYVGTRADKLPTQRQLNPAIYIPGATLANRQQRRIYPEFESITSFDPIGRSRYHGFELTVNKRFGGSYSVLANYGYSKAYDNASSDDLATQDPLNPEDTWGLSDADRRHRLVTSFVWELPSPQTGTARAIFGGWQFNGIVTLSSGTPFTISSGRDTMLSFSTSRANVVGDPNLPTDRSRDELIRQYFDPQAFAVPQEGTLGNSPRNFLIGPGSKNVDLSFFKTFEVRQGLRMQFRAEAFNAFNFVNLGTPRNNITSTDPGRITTAGDARIMQFGLRMTF